MPALLLDGATLIQTATELVPRFPALADRVNALHGRPPVIPGSGRGSHRRYPIFAVDLSADHCDQILAALEWSATQADLDLFEREAFARIIPAWQRICTSVARPMQ